MEMYLHLVNYSIKDFGPGKSALDKKHSKSFGIATHIKVGSAFIFLSYGVGGVKWFPAADHFNPFILVVLIMHFVVNLGLQF